jgi:hypothetical protein
VLKEAAADSEDLSHRSLGHMVSTGGEIAHCFRRQLASHV